MTAKTTTPEQEFLTVAQVAHLYGVHPRTLRDMIVQGKVVAERPAGARRWRISRRWLDVQHPQDSGFLAPDFHRPGLDEETEVVLRRVVREEVQRALADLAAGLAAVLQPPSDELRPRRRA